MQAIVGRLEGLLQRLRRVNYERLLVVSVLVATLTGSLYVYLVDFYFARSPDQAVAPDPELADRVAPIGRVTLAEPVVAAPAAETTLAATDAPAGESAPAESPAEGGIAEVSASDTGSTDAGSTDVAAAPDASPEPPPELSPEMKTDQFDGQAAVSADPIEALSASTVADGVVAAEAEPSASSEDLQATVPAETLEQPRSAPLYPPVPPGFMPIPAQGYAPVYPHYQPPPEVTRPAPGAPSWYAPGPYQAYPPTLYERSVAPPAGYPPPQGWVR
ncbi:hypothetical protein [Thiocapsa sp.]|uniref:hypothetical protein n=1 Tax=Thiocapsa sp. TaxID=2024551 RepID=UPI0025FC8E37|nr:hypothetical protein [Thiocapsa sp.]